MSSPAAGPPPDDPIEPPSLASRATPEGVPALTPQPDDTLRNADEVRQAILAGQALAPPEPPHEPVLVRRRRVLLPLALFLATCASTFAAGLSNWQPEILLAERVTWEDLWK